MINSGSLNPDPEIQFLKSSSGNSERDQRQEIVQDPEEERDVRVWR